MIVIGGYKSLFFRCFQVAKLFNEGSSISGCNTKKFGVITADLVVIEKTTTCSLRSDATDNGRVSIYLAHGTAVTYILCRIPLQFPF